MVRDISYILAERKIEDALKSHNTKLELHMSELSELPESIGHLSHFEEKGVSSYRQFPETRYVVLKTTTTIR